MTKSTTPRPGLQDRLATLLGCEPAARAGVVQRMLHRGPVESTGYWLQLVVAAAIATLGLVLGSTAVVIGAMLVAPLMSPILSLGMGLAVGSPYLVLRGATRVVLSVLVVVAFSAGLTRLLPFHEVNAEIASRTTPTALDLATAVFCAIAGVYSAMRPSSDVATTAAGTSIGISLVPPLCVTGYGLGTSSWGVAYGAALLFSTNFVAIVTVGMGAFAAAGFAGVGIAALEAAEGEAASDARITRAIAQRLSALFASKSGPWLRLLMPLALLAAVYVPLRRGLDEVAWQIRARAEVQSAIAALPGRVVESRVRVERGEIELDMFLLGGLADAESAKRQLTAAVAPVARGKHRIEVHAVADASEFEALERSLDKPAPPPPVIEPPPVPPEARSAEVLAALKLAVEARWPQDSAGWPLAIDAAVEESTLRLEVVHLGTALDAAAEETLSRALTSDVGMAVAVRSAPISPEALRPTPGDVDVIAKIAIGVERSKRTSSVRICLALPALPDKKKPDKKKAESQRDAELRAALLALVAGHPRADIEEGSWSIRFEEDSCS